jgi:hypothetical protein
VSVPDPATTDWVPLYGSGGAGAKLAYLGAYDNAHVYHSGDIVIGPDGITYECVVEGTTGVVPTAWGISPDTAWHIVGAAGEPAFQNGWSAWDARAPRFRRLATGLVVIAGILKSPGSIVNPAFALPIGYRPAAGDDHTFVVNGTTYPVLFNILSDGGIGLTPTFGLPVPANSWIYCDVSFYAEA